MKIKCNWCTGTSEFKKWKESSLPDIENAYVCPVCYKISIMTIHGDLFRSTSGTLVVDSPIKKTSEREIIKRLDMIISLLNLQGRQI